MISETTPAAGAQAHGRPLFLAARFRSEPRHFDVTEHLGFMPTGEGEHAFLFVEKTAANTTWVARQLARHAGVPERDVGYAGLKDRHAITRQWFSVRTVSATVDWGAFTAEGVRIVEATRHERKLKRGAHKENAFRIVLTGLPEALDFGALVERLDTVRTLGVPNYFGEQRFGVRNLENARELFRGKRLKRAARGMALSAARSLLFNAILDARVRAGTWNRLLAGEVANLDGSGSVFDVETVDAELERRLLEWDVHPTATLFGRDHSYRASGAVQALEDAAVAPFEGYASGLAAAGVDCAQRQTRVRPGDLVAVAQEERLMLAFRLPPGAYATQVLAEFGTLEDLSGPRSRARATASRGCGSS